MKSAIFDLDGTIIDSEKSHFDTFNQIFKRFGVSVDKEKWFDLRGLGAKEIFTEVLGERKDIDKLIIEREKLLVAKVEKEGLPVVNGFMLLYNRLKEKNVKVIIATSGHRLDVEEELKSIGLNERFVCANDVEKLKPSPDIFLLAADKINENTDNCVVFEDSSAGIEAAKRAGMYVIGVCATSNKEELKQADKIVEDFTDKSILDLFGFH